MTETLETQRLSASAYSGDDPVVALKTLLADLKMAGRTTFEPLKGTQDTVFASIPALRVLVDGHQDTWPLYGCGYDTALAPACLPLARSKAAADLVGQILEAGRAEAKSKLFVVEPETQRPVKQVVLMQLFAHP